jgi:hypothetical protein
VIPSAVAFEWEVDQLAQEASVVLHAGPSDGPGSETFHIEVVTLTGVAARVARDRIVTGRHLLIVEDINQRRIERFIEDRLRRISGETWHDVALKIGRLGYWEFEDYAEMTAPLGHRRRCHPGLRRGLVVLTTEVGDARHGGVTWGRPPSEGGTA